MSSELSLVNLPDTAMMVLLKKLDFVTIQRLRKTCHHLRNSIDDLKPDASITRLSIIVEPLVIYSHFWYEDDIDQRIEYRKDGVGCSVEYYEMYKKKTKILKDMDLVMVACNDIKSILIFQKSLLNNFTLDFNYSRFGVQEEKLKNLEITSKKFFDKLDFGKPELKVKTFQTTVTNQEQALKGLRYLNPDALVYITIHNTNENSDDLEMLETGELVVLEQWKRAKVLNILNFVLSEPRIEDFSHFNMVYIAVRKVTMEMVTALKEVFLSPSNLHYFKLRFEKLLIRGELIESFEHPLIEANQLGQRLWIWYFKIASLDQVLSMTLYPFQIIFEMEDVANVPSHASIL